MTVKIRQIICLFVYSEVTIHLDIRTVTTANVTTPGDGQARVVVRISFIRPDGSANAHRLTTPYSTSMVNQQEDLIGYFN